MPEGGPCDGLAFVSPAPGLLAELRPLRDEIGEVWRGTLGEAGSGKELLVLAFARPLAIPANAWPTALRLSASSTSTLASYLRTSAAPGSGPSAARPRRLELWWGGAPHRLSFDAMERVSLAHLWDMPRLHVHRAAAPISDGRRAEAGERPEGERVPVSRAAPPIATREPSLFETMNARLRDGTGRTAPFAQLGPAIRRLLGRRDRRGAGPPPPGPWGARPPSPGLFERVSGWLRWHTPLGAPLRRAFGDRLRQVEKLIASGDLDSALRLALKLGGGKRDERLPTHYPNQLPGMRARLDFEVDDGFAAPIFAEGEFASLQWRYRQLADQLERDGDHRRAAYIFSQLLGDHRQAVLTLERGGMFAEGARLAVGSRQEPALAIRLLFLAGELGAALALAKRTACFDQLAEHSRAGEGPFHAFVVEAWTEQLLASGQSLRALQVTDHLTGAAGLAERRRWLAATISAEGPGSFGGEPAIRALLTAFWNGEDLSADRLSEFPFMPVDGGENPHRAALAWFQSVLRGEAENQRDILFGLLAALARLAQPGHDEQAGFWQGPARPLIEAFAIALIEQASSGLGPSDLDAMQSLLGKADLRVLAADIGKLRKLVADPSARSREWRVPPVTLKRPATLCACFLANGTMLIWRETGLLQLIDRQGATLWQGNVRDIKALIAVGTSSNAILVQALPDGSSQLTRFASHSRSFHPIGAVALTAHHDVTSESHWLVQIGGDIGGLDLAKLCAREPRVEFAWSCALTERLLTIAFAHHPRAPSWLTRDISAERYGILESWSLLETGELAAAICLPPRTGTEAELQEPADWYWAARGARMIATDDDRQWMDVHPWSETGEERARAWARRLDEAGYAGGDTFQPCDFNRPFVRTLAPDGAETLVSEPGPKGASMSLRHAPDLVLRCLARAPFEPGRGNTGGSHPKGAVLLGDEHGRLFVVSIRDRRVDVL